MLLLLATTPRDFTKLPEFFDVIIVDAPFCGSGLFRKDKEVLKEWNEANVNCAQKGSSEY